jgi:hypothetical protein
LPILVVVLARMAGRVISCTTQENLPVTEQEAAAAVAAVHDMLGPGQVGNVALVAVLIPDPDFIHPGSRIPDPKTATKERGEKIFCRTFFCSHKYHKIENCFILKIWTNLQRIIELFYPIIVISLSKIWILDPRSGIRNKPLPDPQH